jgi:hypothetical protein
MAAEVEPVGTEGEDYFRVEKDDRTIIVPIRKSDDEKFHSDPQIRALQMVHEGRIGGAGRGQGRKRKPRVGQYVSEEIRKRGDKIVAAIDAGLESENVNHKLKAAGMAVDIDRQESEMQLKEDESDIDNLSKDELIDTLFQLVSEPTTEAALSVIDLPASAVTEINEDQAAALSHTNGNTVATDAEGSTASTSPARANTRTPRRAGRGSGTRDRAKGANPFTAAAHGRPAD